MAAIAKLRARIPEIVEEFFQRCRLAELNREKEIKAITTIQAYSRGFLVRRRLFRLSKTAICIQQFWRGYLGRQRARLALEEFNRTLRQAYFNSKAITIQKWWRGYWSRKNIHDFYARKRYLISIQIKNQQTREMLNIEAERALQHQRQEAENAAHRLFESKISKLHHLVSTQNQSGIFNSPYAIATGTQAIIMGQPIEEHLRASMQGQVKQRLHLPPLTNNGPGNVNSNGINRLGGKARGTSAGAAPNMISNTYNNSSASVDNSGSNNHRSKSARSSIVPPSKASKKVASSRLTLQQTADIEAVHQQKLLDEKVHRAEMFLRHPQPFTTSLSRPFEPHLDVQSNRNLEPYGDPYDPTLGMRGEAFTPAQQLVANGPFLKYIRKQSFFDKNSAEAY